MSCCPSSPRAARLRELACGLLAGGIPVPTAVIVEGDDDPKLSLLPLPADAPVASLLGFRGPPHWDAFGIVASGDARPATPDPEIPASSRSSSPSARAAAWLARGPSQVSVAYLIDRGGAQAALLQVLDRGDPVGPPYDTGGVGGRIPDVCRRVLGVPTPPPTKPVEELWCVDWLDRVVEAVVGRDLGTPVPPWPGLRRLWRGRSSVEHPWAIVRRQVADGTLGIAGITPALAAWMDDGMFSREALAAYPDRGELLADLAELLPPRTMATLVAGIASLRAEDVA